MVTSWQTQGRMARIAPWTFLLLCMCFGIHGQNSVVRQDGLCATFVLPFQGYQCEEFVVETDDGFLLGLQRMSALTSEAKKGPVFLMHGIVSGGDSWVLNPPSETLPFMLADNQYDVWIGNFRTTDFSYGHASYGRNHEEFWDWSLDELAEKDVPTMLKFVYTVTNEKAHYIGFSQGSQVAFASLSQGQLLNWVDKLVFLAPVAYIHHITSQIGLAALKLHLDKVVQPINVFHFTTKTFVGRQFVDLICRAASMRCYNDWITLFAGHNCCVNDTRRAYYDKYETQATSMKNLIHFAQQFHHQSFAKFDYGLWGNFLRYKLMSPPSYDLSRVPTSNMLLIHGENDALADVQDVGQLLRELPQGYFVEFVPTYAHVDFVIGTNAKSLVYDKIIKFLDSQ